VIRWIPEIAQLEPRPLRYRYRVFEPQVLAVGLERSVAAALSWAGVEWRYGDAAWDILLPSSTRVLGLVRREVEEQVQLRLEGTPDGAQLDLDCIPRETHAAHAAALAGVLLVAGGVWLAGGLRDSAPAALTTAIGGGLWADVMREMALEGLERRLRRLLEDVGMAVWPGVPAELL
jgi:hypothetical protein